MFRILCILATHLYGQVVLDLVSSDPNTPRRLYLTGKGIRRRLSDQSIIQSTEWIQMAVSLDTPIAHAALPESGDQLERRSLILRAMDETEIEIPYSNRLGSHFLPGEDGLVGIGLGSAFMRHFPNVFLGPVATSPNQSRLVIELTQENFNLETRCAGPMTYVHAVRFINAGMQRLQVYMLARIIAGPDGDMALGPNRVHHTGMRSAFFSHEPDEILPWDTVVSPLIQHVESRSDARRVGNSGDESSNLQFENCNSLAVFPVILYSFYGHSGSDWHHDKQADYKVYPEDYVDIVIGTDGRSYCNIHIRSESDRGYRQVGSNIIRYAYTHFDASNARIGFCDPAI